MTLGVTSKRASPKAVKEPLSLSLYANAHREEDRCWWLLLEDCQGIKGGRQSRDPAILLWYSTNACGQVAYSGRRSAIP